MRCPTLTELLAPPPGRTGWPWTEESPRVPDRLPDGRPWPKVSIVTPSYNQGQFIEETIRSVLLQGYPNIEYIIIDGGSTDGTVEIIKKYESWLAYWVSEPDRGQSHAINKGFQRATGQILSWLNSDDYFEIGAFRKVATQFTNKPDTVALCGSCLIIDAGGNPMYIKASRSLSPERLLRGGLVPGQPAVFFKHEVIKALGGLDEQFHQSLDREFWVRIGLHYPADKLAQIKDTLAVTRYWPGCKTALGSKSMVEEHKRILAKVFSRKDLPENLKKIRPHAYSEVFWREALMAKDAKAYASVFRALLKATWASPFYSLRRGFEHLMRLITKPMRVQEKVASNQDIPIV